MDSEGIASQVAAGKFKPGAYNLNVQSGSALLDEVHDTLKRYIVWPDEHACVAFTLWIAATHAQTKWEHATRFVFKSPIKRCGKTRAQEVGRELVHDPLSSTNISVAALVHSISEDNPPTLVIDEADSIFGRKKDRPDGAEDLRGILNSGHSRGWPYVRWDPKSRQRDECATFAMALIGGIGDLPDTIEDRGVVTSMRRRAPGERITQFRRKRVLPELHDLRDRLAGWVSAHHEELGKAEPDLPVEDRQADVWESLAAIADLAASDWPERARKACEYFCGTPVVDEATAGELLLKDLYEIWHDSDEKQNVWRDRDEPQLFTETILERLYKIEESPWGDWYGKPLTARNLAKLLRAYNVKSRTVRLGAETAKGYHRDDLADSWHRYVTSVTTSQQGAGTDSDQEIQGVTDRVTDVISEPSRRSEQGKRADCDAVTAVTEARLEGAEDLLEREFGARVVTDDGAVSGWTPPDVGGLAEAVAPLDDALENYDAKIREVDEQLELGAEPPDEVERAALAVAREAARRRRARPKRLRHPAPFSGELLPAIARGIARWRLPVHDPFGGDGEALGLLCDALGLPFTGTEQVPKFIIDARVHEGDSTESSAYPTGDYVVVTSPPYPNGMGDYFKTSDYERRNTYVHALQRMNDGIFQPLPETNLGRYNMRRGKQIEAEYWRLARDVMRHWPARVVLNVKDNPYENDKMYPTVAIWAELLEEHGYEIVARHDVEAHGLREGANSHRADTEAVLVAQEGDPT